VPRHVPDRHRCTQSSATDWLEAYRYVIRRFEGPVRIPAPYVSAIVGLKGDSDQSPRQRLGPFRSAS
jgi:hypothetical protein